MPALYQLALLGAPTDAQVSELEEVIGKAVGMFNLRLGHEVGWEVRPEEFNPDQQRSSAAVFFGGENPPLANVAKLLERGIPLLPVATDVNRVSAEIPTLLQPLNCLAYTAGGSQRVATALLECAGLLPRQRRVFVSYRRGKPGRLPYSCSMHCLLGSSMCFSIRMVFRLRKISRQCCGTGFATRMPCSCSTRLATLKAAGRAQSSDALWRKVLASYGLAGQTARHLREQPPPVAQSYCPKKWMRPQDASRTALWSESVFSLKKFAAKAMRSVPSI